MTAATAIATTPGLTTWTFDSAHTSVEFSVRHLMIATVKGRFAEFSGTVITDEAVPTTGRVEFTINPASIDTRQPQRDAHLRSADFFDVEKFPTLTFRSSRLEAVSGDRFELVGDLTIRGITREVTLDVTSEGRVKDPWGGERAGFSATTRINRSEFGLTWNQALEAGGLAVGDEVKIALDVELIKA